MTAADVSDFDVLVIGGGIVGLSVAAELAAERRVAVLEREPALCYHATGRSSAMFAPNYGCAPVRALTAASSAFYRDPPAPFSKSLLESRDILHVARKTQRARLARLTASAGKGAVFERLRGNAARRHWPELRECFTEALLEKRVGDIDIDALVRGLNQRLKANGAAIVTSLGDARIEKTDGQWRVATERHVFRAPILVNAAGAWADQVARDAGVATCGLTPLRRTVVLLSPPADLAFRHRPTVFDIDQRFYFRPFAGAVLAPACDETPCCPCDATPTEIDVARAVAAYEAAVSQPVGRVIARWAGLRTFAPDRAPVLGEAPDASGFFWAAGLGGAGIQTAPAVGEFLAGLILGGKLRPRFAEYGVTQDAYAPARSA